jgi:hypothetical protein
MSMDKDKDEARRVATAAGLTKLTDRHLTELARGVASGRELSSKLPKDLHWSEEIALVFRLPQPREASR